MPKLAKYWTENPSLVKIERENFDFSKMKPIQETNVLKFTRTWICSEILDMKKGVGLLENLQFAVDQTSQGNLLEKKAMRLNSQFLKMAPDTFFDTCWAQIT